MRELEENEQGEDIDIIDPDLVYEDAAEQEQLAAVERRYPLRERRPPQRLVFTLYQQALKERPLEATAALDKELDNAEVKGIWRPVFEKDLTPEQRGLILNNMINHVVKYKPSGEYDKDKVRVLMRGDTQTEIGETSGPVCRVESIFVVISIALLYNLPLVKIDFVAAYLNTPMPDEVKHKWIRLDKWVSKRLVQRDSDKWSKYVDSDGRILVEMQRLLYGYKEAAHYWNKVLLTMYIKAGYRQLTKDKCVVVYTSDAVISVGAITVDDCLHSIHTKELERLLGIMHQTFGEVTVEQGDTINVVGMSVQLDRSRGSAKIQQKQFISKLLKVHGVSGRAPTPSTDDLFDEPPGSPLLSDQRAFMSLNAGAAFAGKRTYPEIQVVTSYLASKYGKATELDQCKAMRMLEYLNYHEDHCLFLRPASLDIVAAADASYAEHEDAKSHSGGCIGFQGVDGMPSYFMFISSKQPIVTKSSCESELVCLNTVGDHTEWLRQLVVEMELPGYISKPVIMQQDNKSTIIVAGQGTGTFKRTKHIRVRYYWIKQLMDEGLLELQYMPTKEIAADLLSKPLVGQQFKYLLRKVLGWVHM